MKPVPGSTGNIEKKSLMARASHAWVSRWAQKPQATRPVWGGEFRLAVWLARRTVASVIGTHHFGEPWGGKGLVWGSLLLYTRPRLALAPGWPGSQLDLSQY